MAAGDPVEGKPGYVDDGTGNPIPKAQYDMQVQRQQQLAQGQQYSQSTGPTNTGMAAAATIGGLIQRKGQVDTDAAGHYRREAELSQEQSARAGRDAQRGYQLANRDERVEGQKDAGTRAAAQYGQKMAQISGAAGGGAAALASMNVQDPSADIKEHRARADQQQLIGQQGQTQAEGAAKVAEVERGLADEENRTTQDITLHNAGSDALSTAEPDVEETVTTETATEPEPADVPPPKPEEPGEPPTPPEAEVDMADFDPQDVLNALIGWGSQERRHKASSRTPEGEAALQQAVTKLKTQPGIAELVGPATQAAAADGATGTEEPIGLLKDAVYALAGKKSINATSGQHREGANSATAAADRGSVQTATVKEPDTDESDARVKNIKSIVSDSRLKNIYSAINRRFL